MLCAYNQQYQDAWATRVEHKDGPFSCPACREPVILKKGRIKIPHFAHQPESDCSYAGQGESEAHREAKLEIHVALLNTPGVTDVKMERYLHEVRPDVSFRWQASFIAIEVQISVLKPEDIERRTKAYASKNMAVLWTPPLPLALFEERYAPRDWERYLHSLYSGKVYYWSKDLILVPVHFEDYWLPPSWYSDEKRSKRFVTPAFRHSRSVLDLTSVWRSAWGRYPRAQLWREARQPEHEAN